MPRIVFYILQVALLTGIVLVGLSIAQKQAPPEEAPPATASAPIKSKPDQKQQNRPKPFAHYQGIARRDLFRTPKADEPAPAAIDIEALKPTELKLKLWGTITGEDGMTRAVIEDLTKRQQAFYRAGEEVSSAKVKLILREKVILSVKGEDQILEIEKPSGTRRPVTAKRATPAAQAQKARRPAESRAPASRAVRLKLSRLGPISENPEDWSKYASAAPFKDEDGVSGLMLNRITPASPLRRLGIRNGDVLLDINDQPVNELGDILKTLAQISAGEEMRLKIKRRGRERKLDFKFE